MATAKRARTTKPKTTKSETSQNNEVARVTTQAVNINEAIRTRAYELYEQRGRQDGYHEDDWLRAESEVLSRFGARA